MGELRRRPRKHTGRWNSLSKNDDICSALLACAIVERVMKDWSWEMLVLVVKAFSLIIAHIVGLHLGWLVDEDALVKLTEVQV